MFFFNANQENKIRKLSLNSTPKEKKIKTLKAKQTRLEDLKVNPFKQKKTNVTIKQRQQLKKKNNSKPNKWNKFVHYL